MADPKKYKSDDPLTLAVNRAEPTAGLQRYAGHQIQQQVPKKRSIGKSSDTLMAETGRVLEDVAADERTYQRSREDYGYSKGGLVKGCKHHACKVTKTGWHH